MKKINKTYLKRHVAMKKGREKIKLKIKRDEEKAYDKKCIGMLQKIKDDIQLEM